VGRHPHVVQLLDKQEKTLIGGRDIEAFVVLEFCPGYPFRLNRNIGGTLFQLIE